MKTRHALFAVLFCGYFGISLATDFTATDKALRAGNHESAVAALKQVTAETREDIYGVLLRQAEIALGVGNATLAESLFEKAIFQMPTATEAQAGLTSALMAQGRVKEAQAEARRALREAPDDVMLGIAVAQMENRIGQPDAALARLEKSRSNLPGRAIAETRALLMAQVEILMERGRVPNAVSRLKDWLNRHPDDATALDWLGQAEYVLGNRSEGSRLRALAAMRYHTEGHEVKAAEIAEWMRAMALLHPMPAAKDVSKTQTKPDTTQPAKPVTTPETTTPRIEYAEAPPVVRQSPENKRKPAPRPLPEARFDPIHIPKGATIATGSGFIIDGGERVVTNAHVVGEAKQITVRNGIGQVRKARVEVISKEHDLAVLRLESPYPANWAVSRERIEEPRPGRSCYVLGYPLAGTLGATWPALTSGLVSRTDGGLNGLMQITASLNSGNSGGPVVDDQGNLIGIVVSKLDTLKYAEKHGQMPEDVNFAIRPSRLLNLLSTLQRPVAHTESDHGKMDAEAVYELMLPSVVLVVAPQG
jgi:S1-C subfamily serine protease/Tfp pilus assembly protein PilF